MKLDAPSALPAYPAVQAALAGVRAEHGVHIPLAVESGSRAWGFPSPEVAEAVAALVARKAVTREMGSASVLDPGLAGLVAFIRGEFEAAAGWEAAEAPAPGGEAKGAAAALYRATVERLDGGGGGG